MKLIGKGRDIEENHGRINEKRFVEIYTFDDPEIVNYDTGFIGVHPKNNNYRHWLIENNSLREVQDSGILHGIGIYKDYLFDVNENTLEKLSEELGVEKHFIKSILS